jgi:hypothetical protein
MIPKSLVADIKRGQYELTDGGIFVPKANMLVGGFFEVDHMRDGELIHRQQAKNIIVNQGLNHALNVILNAASQITQWYVAIFEGNYAPVAADTAAGIVANSTESTAYTESTRPTYDEATSTAQSTTNSASRATFSINATKTIYGAYLISSSGKSSATGTLFAAAKFSTSRAVQNLDQLLVTYTINASSV